MKLLILFFYLYICIDSVAYANQVGDKNNIEIDYQNIEKKRFRENFQNSYTSEEFNYEPKKQTEESWVAKFWRRLMNKLKSLFKFDGLERHEALFKIIAIIIPSLLFLVLVYFIAKAYVKHGADWIFGKKKEEQIRYADIEKDIHSIDFEKLIDAAISKGQMRLCVRYYYLWLLKKMSDRNLIDWDIKKTNSDYFYELKKQSHKEEFRYLSYLYDYIWYGEFALEEKQFLEAKDAFEKTIKSIGGE